MNEQVTTYINNAPEEQKKIMEVIRALIHKHIPGVTENIKWSRPVFSTAASDFAYFKVTKAYLTFGVFNFDKIKDEAHLWEGTGKDMRHIKLRKDSDVNPELMVKWIHSASQ